MTNKRFKVLRGALRYLRTSEKDIDVTLPAGTPLRKFQDWDNNKVKIDYTRDPDSKPEELLVATLTPFALPLLATSIAKVKVSKRANTNTTIKAAFADAALTVVDDGTGQVFRGFTPAKCTVTIPDSTKNKAGVPSQYTGIKYDRVGKRSYTFPYGKKTGQVFELETRQKIIDQFKANSKILVSFQSEKY